MQALCLRNDVIDRKLPGIRRLGRATFVAALLGTSAILLAGPAAAPTTQPESEGATWQKPQTSVRSALLFDPALHPTLRERAQTGWLAPMADRLLRRADTFLKVPVPSAKPEGAIAGRVLTIHVLELAVAGELTGERRYTEHAIALLVASAVQGAPADYFVLNDALAVGDAAGGYALGYDLLRPHLTPDQDVLLREELRQFGQWLFEHSQTAFWGREEGPRYAHNWNAVTHAPLGLCGLLLDEPAWVERATHRIRLYLRHAFDPTGAAFEGLHYLGYGLNSAMPFIQALHRQGGPDLLDGQDHLVRIPRFVLHSLFPWGGGCVPINQAEHGPTPSAWMHVLLDRYDDRVGLWAWLRVYGDPVVHGGDGTWGAPDYLGTNVVLPLALLWADPTLEPLHPTEAEVETVQAFQLGWGFARDSWEEEAALVTFTSGDGLKGIWNHADTGGFTFSALGERFAVELGPHSKSSDLHNTLLVDGKGQDSAGQAEPSAGRLLAVQDRGDFVYFKGDLAPAYQKRLQTRQFQREMILGKGEHPYLLIVDRFAAATAPHELTWLMYTDPDNAIEAGVNGVAKVVGARTGAACHVRMLWPEQAPLEVRPPLDGRVPAASLAATVSGNDVLLITLLQATPAGEEPTDVTVQQRNATMVVTIGRDTLRLSPAGIQTKRE